MSKICDNFSFQELTDMNLAHGTANCNEREAEILCKQRYPERLQWVLHHVDEN